MMLNARLKPNKRKQPSSVPSFDDSHRNGSARRFKIDEQRGCEASGFCVLVKDLRNRRIFSPCQIDEAPSTTTEKVGASRCPPDLRESKVNEGLGKLDQMDSVQTTPPEAVQVFDHSGHGLSRNADQVSTKQSNVIRSSQPVSMTRSDPSLCLRGRLFNVPISFSYRRLLPYLTDMVKEDDFDVTRTCQTQTAGKVLEEKLPQQVSETGQDKCLGRIAAATGLSPQVAIAIPVDPKNDLPAAVCSATPVDKKKDLSPCSVLSPALVNKDSSDIRISSEGGDVISDSLNLDQSQVKLYPGKCSDGDTGECPDDAKMEREKTDKGELSTKGGADELVNVIPTDKDEYHKASIREQVSLRSSANPIDSQNRSNSSERSVSTWKPSNGTSVAPKSSSPEDSKKMPIGRKKVSKSCLQAKILKNHNSFSYRRLLPYLMEIVKDDPSTVGKSPPQENVCSKENLHTAPESLSHPEPLSDNPNYRSPAEELPLASFLQKDEDGSELTSKVSESKLESSPEKEKVANELCPAINEEDRLFVKDSAQYGTYDIGIPPMETRRGILKRNPQGCRGLCLCLNCASFRLNAERAFEFSRNQMKDAEELALDLMKEMTHLRSLLQKIDASSATPDIQVVEACRKASEVEDMAKDRLSQMNEDLNIHSRIKQLHRPRVIFSQYCTEYHST
ncbi:hypothetical protein SAY87_004443 [Trapa incisa]|uniref:Uncharacterized protein n=1 Tax=Trapa incisa TaxID=236973 RepID=A0AAN7PM14_9MYRT|nr:hypothetical protein SAY87_004443 [Trapa incisa]